MYHLSLQIFVSSIFNIGKKSQHHLFLTVFSLSVLELHSHRLGSFSWDIFCLLVFLSRSPFSFFCDTCWVIFLKHFSELILYLTTKSYLTYTVYLFVNLHQWKKNPCFFLSFFHIDNILHQADISFYPLFLYICKCTYFNTSVIRPYYVWVSLFPVPYDSSLKGVSHALSAVFGALMS